MNTWPTQAECRRFYGAPGTNQTILTLPYAMTYDGKPVTRMTINTIGSLPVNSVNTSIVNDNTVTRAHVNGLLSGSCQTAWVSSSLAA
jgi:hypothetical protein